MKKDYTISLEIYDDDKILEAIEDFADVCPISYKGGTLSFEGESEEETQEVFQEFMNYVLSL